MTSPTRAPSAATTAAGEGMTVLLSTVSSDAHTWNLVYLQLLIEEYGHRVVNLGPCVPEEALVARALHLRPDLIVISSVNGHGRIDGERLIRAVRAEAELAAVPVVIGGKLTIDGALSSQARDALLAAGYDEVFGTDAEAPRFRSLLQHGVLSRDAVLEGAGPRPVRTP